MSDLLKAVDDRTNLAGTNRLEVLMFRLEDKGEDSELFGLNVFKVRELMEVPEVMKMPGSSSCMLGVANIRGKSVPIIDLKEYCGIKDDTPPKILVVTEYNSSVQGFLVHDVDNIMQLEWSQIKPPPEMLGNKRSNILTAISRLKDNRMLLILDVEKVLSEVLGTDIQAVEEIDTEAYQGLKVFFADDSAVARAQVAKILDNMGISHTSAKNGLEAWEMLQKMADEAKSRGVLLREELSAIVTDVEMPEMDGYVLTRKLKEDPRFYGIPVMMHSSLSADGNIRLGTKVGADAYVPKLKPKEFSEMLDKLMEGAEEAYA